MSATEEESLPPAESSPRVSVPLTELEESVGDHQHCLVCYSDLHHTGILPCNHNEICGVCHLRLRHLHGNKKCPICKEEHEKIISDVPGKKFDEYPMWGEDLGSNYIFKKKVGMFFPTDYYASVVEPLFGYPCRQPGCDYDGKVPDVNIYEQMQQETEGDDNENTNNNTNNNNQKKNKSKKPPTQLRALQDHLRIKHRLTCCQLCIDHKRDFVALLPRLAPHQLKKHLTKGDGPGSGFEGHPVCEFCRPKRFYDLTHLHIHLQKEHYKCHVCEKRGLQNQFFRNYQSLEKHFDRSHFLCHDVQCLQARFVVFDNEIDLQAHERQVHGGTTAGSSKIQLEFRTRRTGYDGSGVEAQRQEVPSEEDFNYGLQGEAFVPDALPQSDGPTLHPLHLQRTAEFRAQSAQIRQQQEQESQGNAFPTLQAATAGTGGTEAGEGQQALNIGWTAGTTAQRVAVRKKNAGEVTESDFPALPSSGPKNAASAKLRAAPVNRQFAAIRATAMQPVAAAPASASWGGARPMAAAPSSHQYNAASFPAMVAAAPVNRMENLAPDNFPALGGGTKKAPKYATATNLAKRYQNPQQPPSWNSAVDFPAPSTGSGPSAAAKRPATMVPVAAPRQAPPSLNSQFDFPAPPSASNSNNSVKQRVLGTQAKQPTRAAMSNMLKAPQTSVQTPANPQDTLRDMQASLGPAKYKKLKNYTRDFAQDDLAPDAYIDHAAALFDRGYGDPDFWKTMPALVSSCPNQSSANEALRYMESLRTTVKAPPAPVPILSAPPGNASNSWGSAPLDLTPESFPTPAVAATRNNNNWGAGTTATPAAVSGRNVPATRYVVPGAKKKNAWGGSSVASTVKQAKVTTGSVVSVASAAASEGPQGGTATKFMAQQQKQQQHQQKPQQNTQGKKKKKKEKDELRNLAFGK